MARDGNRPGAPLLALILTVLLTVGCTNDDSADVSEDTQDEREVDGGEGGEEGETTSTAELSRVIDGDTFETLEGEKVRLLGINTEESGQPYSQEAAEWLEELLGTGNITLEADREDRDSYGRLLRHVHVAGVEGERVHVNLEMVREGYAHAYVFRDNPKYKDELFGAEQEAREAGRMIWQPSPHNVTVVRIQAEDLGDGGGGEHVVLENEGLGEVDMTGWYVKDQSRHTYVFPDFTLGPGDRVSLYTGAGTDDEDTLYWDYAGTDPSATTTTVWNDGGDAAFLRDTQGLLVNFYTYGNRVQ